MPRPRDSTIRLEQTLHGYDDGHQLLSASCILDGESRARLLIMSDLAGAGVSKGFATYTTGYPLEDAGYYAFARTWTAPEMPRPGCVWTHTLLIPNADVARTNHLKALNELFLRPTVGTSFETYERPVRFDLPDQKVQSGPYGPVVRATVDAFYTRPDHTIVVSSDTSAVADEVVFEVWDMQWPRMRREFRFCTGVLSAEDVGRQKNDIEGVPIHVVRSMGSDDHVVVIPADSPQRTIDSSTAYALDATGDERRSLTEFLRRYGPDFEHGRAAALSLMRVHLSLSGATAGNSVEELMSTLSSEFPRPTSGRRLKAELLGCRSGSPIHLDHAAVLTAVGTTEAAAAINLTDLDLPARASALHANNPKGASSTFEKVASAHTTRAESVVDALAHVLEPQDVQFISNLALQTLARLRPEVLTWPETWSRPVSQQQALLTISAECLDNDATWGAAFLTAGVLAEPPIGYPNFAARLPKAGLDTFLDVLGRIDRSKRIHPSWTSALQGHPDVLTEFLNQRQQTLASVWVTAAAAADAHIQPEMLSFEYWLTAPKAGPLVELDERDHDRAAVFLLALALRSQAVAAVELARISFARVFDAAEKGRNLGAAWPLLNKCLPFIWSWWDQCERLVQGTSTWCSQNQVQALDFVRVFCDTLVLERAAQFLAGSWSGLQYLRSVSLGVSEDQNVTSTVRDILHRYADNGTWS